MALAGLFWATFGASARHMVRGLAANGTSAPR